MDARRPRITLPTAPAHYDPAEQSQMRRIIMDGLAQSTQDTVPLTMRARVTATSATQITIRVAVADPYPQGANSASIAYTYTISSGAGTYTPSSPQTVTPESTITESAGTYVDFTVDRPAAESGIGRITFTASASNRLLASDAVDVASLDLVYSQCLATVTAVSATQITVTVTANASTGTPTVGLVTTTGSASVASGHAAGTYSYAQNGTDNVWVFNRGAFGTGVGQAQFRAVFSGTVEDDDFVDIPEVGRDTVYLSTRARVMSTTATTVTARFAVADPYPQGANSATITYLDLGTGGVSPASGGTMTPESTLTENAGTYIDYTITRPAFQNGTGRVTFTATASGRISDSDAVDVPAQERDTVALIMRVSRGTTTGNSIACTAAVADPYPQGSGNVTVAATASGGASVSPASATIACTSTTADIDTTGTASFTITRGSTPGRVTFKATNANRVTDVDAVDVEQDPSSLDPGTGVTAVIDRIYVSAVDYTLNEITVAWSYSGSIGSGDFQLIRVRTDGTSADLSGTPTTVGTSNGASPDSNVDTVPDDITSTTGVKVTYSWLVRVRNASGTVVGTSNWLSVTYSHA